MIYLDENYMAHPQQDDGTTLMPWEDFTGFFTGKCDAFIEGYRVVPEGHTWTRNDGVTFSGLMIAPAVDPKLLLAAQANEDEETIAELDAVVVDLTYQNILFEMGV
jgi:hypothetical protein